MADILTNTSGRDVQMMLAVIDQAMVTGIADMGELRRALQSRLDEIMLAVRKRGAAGIKQDVLNPSLCPSCSRGNLVAVFREGILYQACYECRFSQMVQK